MDGFDPRITPARAEVAASWLAGKVEAARFVAGEEREVFDALAPVRRAPSPEAALDTEALKGERVTVFDEDGEGWCWGQLATDGYVGWLPAAALVRPGPPPTHKVAALRTFAFPGPSIKLPPVQALSLGCRLAVTQADDTFVMTAGRWFVPRGHVAELAEHQPDFVAVAERFVGVPYLWGGKSSLGLDCSGLVQVALAAAGIASPRDSDMQERALGRPLAEGEALQRGDLLFWKGHVAIVCDAKTIVHANAYHMAVTVEPVAMAVARIRATGNDMIAIKRL